MSVCVLDTDPSRYLQQNKGGGGGGKSFNLPTPQTFIRQEHKMYSNGQNNNKIRDCINAVCRIVK